MYCNSCGRKISNTCYCLNKKPITRTEVSLVFMVVTTIPLVFFVDLYQTRVNHFNHYVLQGSIIFGLILISLAIFTYVFKKSYLALIFGCHQDINKSLSIFGKHLSICSRCTGIFIGILMTIIYAYLDFPTWILFILAIPLLLDGIIQKKTSYESNNTKRLITGILFGPFLMVLYAGYHYMLISIAFYILERL